MAYWTRWLVLCPDPFLAYTESMAIKDKFNYDIKRHLFIHDLANEVLRGSNKCDLLYTQEISRF